MSYDQFYDAIKYALKNKRLNPDLFERCVCDLLQSDFPGIIPIQGGKDAGMDGAIADGAGEPYPLICTTSESFERNLVENIESYIKAGRPRRKAVFAVKAFLSPQERLRLFDKARAKNFDLVQIFDGEALAIRLYMRPDWCQRLLGISGVPPALSIFPKTQRPIIGEKAIGRALDLEWLKKIDSDRILFGQPGCGKTFLLHFLSKEGWGLFAVNENSSELANSIRPNSPSVIIVDDAHVYYRLLSRNELRDYHLAPLENIDSSALAPMAKEARLFYDVKKIAQAIFGHSRIWQGKESKYWSGQLKKYKERKNYPDELVREIADELVEMAKSRYDIAIEREQHEDLYGFGDN